MGKILAWLGVLIGGYCIGDLVQRCRIRKMNKEIEAIKADHAKQLQTFEEEVNTMISEYEKILKKAFSEDPKEAFEGSVELARYSGVPEDQILKSKEEIDQFFTGKS